MDSRGGNRGLQDLRDGAVYKPSVYFKYVLLLHKRHFADYAALILPLCHFEGIALLAQV